MNEKEIQKDKVAEGYQYAQRMSATTSAEFAIARLKTIAGDIETLMNMLPRQMSQQQEEAVYRIINMIRIPIYF